MDTHIAYCSACEREVKIVITDEPSQDGHANLFDAEIVCLEIGAHCSGNLCPVGAAPPTVMAARLVHNGLSAQVHPVVRLNCERCATTTPHVLIDRKFATCTDCGATSERRVPVE